MVCVLCVPYAVCIHVGALGLAVCYMFCKLSTLHVLMCVMYACGQFLYMCAFCAHEAVLCICVDVHGSGYAVCIVCVLCV